MIHLPQCHERLYPVGSGPHVEIAVVGSPAAIAGLGDLPQLSEQIRWSIPELPGSFVVGADLVFVLWSNECCEQDWNWLASEEPRLGPILIHHVDQKVPLSIRGFPTVRLPYVDNAASALLRAVNMLVVPLIYRSEICLDYLDLAFMMAKGGRLKMSGPFSLSGSAIGAMDVISKQLRGSYLYFLVLVPDSGFSDRELWALVDDLAQVRTDLSLFASHYYQGRGVIVWAMLIEH